MRARDDALSLVQKYQDELAELQERANAAEQRLAIVGRPSEPGSNGQEVSSLKSQLGEQTELVAKLRRNLSEAAGSSLKMLGQVAQMKKDLAARDARIAELSSATNNVPAAAAAAAHDCAADPRCAAAVDDARRALETAQQEHSNELMRVEIDAGARVDAEVARADRAEAECQALREQLRDLAATSRMESDAALRVQDALREAVGERDHSAAASADVALERDDALHRRDAALAQVEALRLELDEAKAASARLLGSVAEAKNKLVAERDGALAQVDALRRERDESRAAAVLARADAERSAALAAERDDALRHRDAALAQGDALRRELDEVRIAAVGRDRELALARADAENAAVQLRSSVQQLQGDLDAAVRARDGFAQEASVRVQEAGAAHAETAAALRADLESALRVQDELRQELAQARADLQDAMDKHRRALVEQERLRALVEHAAVRGRQLEEAASNALRALAAAEEQVETSRREGREQAAAASCEQQQQLADALQSLASAEARGRAASELAESLRAELAQVRESSDPDIAAKVDELQRFNEEVLGLLEAERNSRVAEDERLQIARTDLATERGSHMVTLRQLEEQKRRAAELEARASSAAAPAAPIPASAAPTKVSTAVALPKLVEAQRLLAEVAQEASAAADLERQIADLREELRRATSASSDPFGRRGAPHSLLRLHPVHRPDADHGASGSGGTDDAFQDALAEFFSGPLNPATEAVWSRAVQGFLRRVDSDAVRRDMCMLRDRSYTLHRIVGVFESDLQQLLSNLRQHTQKR